MTQYIKKFNKTQKSPIKPKKPNKTHKAPPKKNTCFFLNKTRVFASPEMHSHVARVCTILLKLQFFACDPLRHIRGPNHYIWPTINFGAAGFLHLAKFLACTSRQPKVTQFCVLCF